VTCKHDSRKCVAATPKRKQSPTKSGISRTDLKLRSSFRCSMMTCSSLWMLASLHCSLARLSRRIWKENTVKKFKMNKSEGVSKNVLKTYCLLECELSVKHLLRERLALMACLQRASFHLLCLKFNSRKKRLLRSIRACLCEASEATQSRR